MSGLASLVLLAVVAGWAVTYGWRFAGVYLAERMAPDSEVLLWVRAVATALVAALVARIILVPPGQLGSTALEARVMAMVLGVAGFYLFRRQMGLGVATAVLSLFVMSWWFGG